VIVARGTNVSPKYSSGRDSNYSRESKKRFWLPNRPLKKLAICMELIIFRKKNKPVLNLNHHTYQIVLRQYERFP